MWLHPLRSRGFWRCCWPLTTGGASLRFAVEVSIVRLFPLIAGWFRMENPNLKWMMSGGTTMISERPKYWIWVYHMIAYHEGHPSFTKIGCERCPAGLHILAHTIAGSSWWKPSQYERGGSLPTQLFLKALKHIKTSSNIVWKHLKPSWNISKPPKSISHSKVKRTQPHFPWTLPPLFCRGSAPPTQRFGNEGAIVEKIEEPYYMM